MFYSLSIQLKMLALIFSIFIADEAWAQSVPDETPQVDESLTVTGSKVKSEKLDQSKASVSGSRLGLQLKETPATFEILEHDEILKRGYGSLLEAVESGNGMSGGNPPGAPTVFSTRGFSGDSVSILYNGIRIANPGMSTSPGDTWNLQSIEILKGPASVLHGYGAVGGAVNYISKRPNQEYQQFEGLLAIGSWNKLRVGAGSGGPITDSLSYRVDLSQQNADTYVDDAPYQYQAASTAFLYQLNDEWTLGLEAEVNRNDISSYFGSPLRDNRLDERFLFNNYNVEDNKTLIDAQWLRLKTEWNPSPHFRLQNLAYRYAADRHWKNVEYYSYDATQDKVLASDLIEIKHDQELIGDQLMMTIQHNPFDLANSFLLGLDVSRNNFTHINNSGYSGTFVLNPDNPESVSFESARQELTLPKRNTVDQHTAIFLENRLVVAPELQIVLGARSDSTRIRSKNLNPHTGIDGQPLNALEPGFTKTLEGITGRFGLVSEIIPNLHLFAQHTTAESSPVSLVTLAKRSEDFKLEKSRQSELGIKQSLWKGFDATWSVYQITKQNLVTRDPKDPTRNEQIGQQSSAGMELSWTLRPSRSWLWQGNIAILKASFDRFYAESQGLPVSYKGKKPTHVPEQVVSTWVDYEQGPFATQMGLRYVGERQADNLNSFAYSAYTLLHGALAYRTGNYEVALRGKNLSDQRYIQWGDGGDMALVGEPRSWELSLHTSL